jgi:hypothetical protein
VVCENSDVIEFDVIARHLVATCEFRPHLGVLGVIGGVGLQLEYIPKIAAVTTDLSVDDSLKLNGW